MIQVFISFDPISRAIGLMFYQLTKFRYFELIKIITYSTKNLDTD